jgi:hypothetical protein
VAPAILVAGGSHRRQDPEWTEVAGATERFVRLRTKRFVKKNSVEETQKSASAGNIGGTVQPRVTIRDGECEIKQYTGMREILQS